MDDRRHVKINGALYPVMEDRFTDNNEQPPPNEHQDDQAQSEGDSQDSRFAGDGQQATPTSRQQGQSRPRGRGGGRSSSQRL